MKRSKKAIYPVATLFVFSGIAFLLGFIFVMSGLAGGQKSWGATEISFLFAISIALISYGFIFVNITKQLLLKKWKGLLISEKLCVLVVIVMFGPVYSTLATAWHIASVYLMQNA